MGYELSKFGPLEFQGPTDGPFFLALAEGFVGHTQTLSYRDDTTYLNTFVSPHPFKVFSFILC
jgi:hypothetical protein